MLRKAGEGGELEKRAKGDKKGIAERLRRNYDDLGMDRETASMGHWRTAFNAMTASKPKRTKILH
jgi:hypothetical protein